MKKYLPAIIHGIIPALFITLPIGSVYAFSLFSSDMANILSCSFKEIQFAFSLSIFFLGMGAAFGGSLVEKNVKVSALISAVLFFVGLICTGLSLYTGQLWLIYLGYGCLCGIAQGVGYLTPVKTLLMWFPKNKGLATAISIVSFGLGSSLCTVLHGLLIGYTGILNIFFALGAIYLIMMLCGSSLIKKPYIESSIEKTISTEFNYKSLLKDKFFLGSWLFMFLNISAGLSLIGSSVNIFEELNASKELVVILMMLAGCFNGGFRLIFAWISDKLKNRVNVWLMISVISIVLMSVSFIYSPFLLIAVVVLNSVYGGGFSTLPGILSEKYDLTCLSRVHGAVLSAWGIAGLIGNNISTLIYGMTGSFLYVPYVLLLMYIVNMVVSIRLKKNI